MAPSGHAGCFLVLQLPETSLDVVDAARMVRRGARGTGLLHGGRLERSEVVMILHHMLVVGNLSRVHGDGMETWQAHVHMVSMRDSIQSIFVDWSHRRRGDCHDDPVCRA